MRSRQMGAPFGAPVPFVAWVLEEAERDGPRATILGCRSIARKVISSDALCAAMGYRMPLRRLK